MCNVEITFSPQDNSARMSLKCGEKQELELGNGAHQHTILELHESLKMIKCAHICNWLCTKHDGLLQPPDVTVCHYKYKL